MSAPIGYPKEVWVAIKTLWESVPKISLTEVRTQVGDSMGCSTPTESIIARKIKDKKWKKTVRKTDRIAVRSLVTTDGENDGGVTASNAGVTSNDDGSIDGQCTDVSVESASHNHPIDPTQIFREAKRVLNAVEKTIKSHRTRNENLGEMQDTLVEQFEDILAIKLDTNAENFEIEAKKTAAVLRIMQLKTGVLTDLAMANKAIQSSDRESWGIESSGDDSTNEIRKVDSAILDKKLADNRKALTQQKEVYVNEKIKRIESGEIFNAAS